MVDYGLWTPSGDTAGGIFNPLKSFLMLYIIWLAAVLILTLAWIFRGYIYNFAYTGRDHRRIEGCVLSIADRPVKLIPLDAAKKKDQIRPK
jgi:hypothetical protein